MKKILLIPLLLFPFFNCISQNTDTNNVQNKQSLDSLWHQLVFIDGGCLTNGQYIKNGRFGSEGCIMSDDNRRGEKWHEFFAISKKELTLFLVRKFSDTTTTKIHTCPCMPSKNGEVALYALHNIYKMNWFHLNGFTKYASKKSSNCSDNQQAWIWEILLNDKEREALTEQWLIQLEK